MKLNFQWNMNISILFYIRREKFQRILFLTTSFHPGKFAPNGWRLTEGRHRSLQAFRSDKNKLEE